MGDIVMNIWLILFFLLAGFTAGYYNPQAKSFIEFAGMITKIGLIFLLISMGARMGIDKRIINQLNQIGLQALIIALASIAGSIIIIKIFSIIIKYTLETDHKLTEDRGTDKTMTFTIVLSVLGGILIGIFILSPASLKFINSITTLALAVLLFGVGVDIGQNRVVFQQLKKMGWQIIFIPLLIAIASIVSSLVAGMILGLKFNEAAAVGAGFGWYSLSGVLLTKIYSVQLGSVAFLTNVFRELITFIILPFVVKYLGRITAIAPGGATTMDVTLPLIKEVAGEEIVIPAFISGVVLSSLVPVLVPFLINL